MCIDQNKKGLVIITVLWTVVILTVMVAILGRKSRLDLKVGASRMNAVRCKWASRAGIEKAMAVLKDDETQNDTLVDTWSDNAEDFNDVMLERCWFTVKVIDEASKLNINTATKDQLMGLPNMLEDIADAIIDWRDENDIPEPMGAESGYYESLTFGYSARNGPFKTIREVLLIKDITNDLFYGEDTNLNGQLDYNERDGDLSPPLDDGDDVLDVGWAAYLTCYSSIEDPTQSNQNQDDQEDDEEEEEETTTESEQNNQNNNAQAYAKININTASEIVLACLFGGGNDAERNALAIIDYRESETEGIQDPSELVEKQILDQNTFSQIENYITTSSDIFTIQCVATADQDGPNDATLITEAVVDRSETPCKVLFWYQGANN